MVLKKNAVGKKEDSSSETTIAILAHALGIFVGILGPLIVLIATKNPQVRDHAKNALNWQITYLIVTLIFLGLLFIGAFGSIFLAISNPAFIIGYFLSFVFMVPIFVLNLANLIQCIIAAVKASEGEAWKYPLAIPLFK